MATIEAVEGRNAKEGNVADSIPEPGTLPATCII